jgi:hypothetical protein
MTAADMPQHLPGVLHSLEPTLNHFGYLAVVGLVLIEDFGVPGISGIHWAKFLAYNAIGAALWVVAWTTVGYLSGSHINSIYDTATHYSTYVAIALGALLLAYVIRLLARMRRARANTAT